MRLHDGTIVSRAEVSKHKFGGDPMAEYLWLLSLDSGYDRCTGDAVDWDLWVAQYGKRLEVCNSQGFVWVDKYPNEAEASAAFDEIDENYSRTETWEEDG